MKRIIAYVGLLVLAIAVLALVDGTRGGMAYFSPDTLEYRTQSEFTILRGRIPLWRSTSEAERLPLIEAAIENDWIRPTHNAPRWELDFHWNGAWRDGDGPLYDFFHRNDERIIELSLADSDWAELYWGEGFGLLQSDSEADRNLGRWILCTGWRMDSVEELRHEILSIQHELKLPPEPTATNP